MPSAEIRADTPRYDELKAGYQLKLSKAENTLKALHEEQKAKLREASATKEAMWKGDMAELRTSHREQIAKVKANVKMVEAAQKVVELNCRKELEKSGSGKGPGVVKLE